jgi:telomerase reverse transcriptase
MINRILTRVQVYRYVVHCVKAVIPRAFWGSDHNFRLTCSSMHNSYRTLHRHISNIAIDIRRLVQARRYETLSLHEVLQGFKVRDCDLWLGAASERAGQQRSSVSDSIKCRELLEEFIYWFFESFVLSLIKVSTFQNFPIHCRIHRGLRFVDHLLCDRIFSVQELCTVFPAG